MQLANQVKLVDSLQPPPNNFAALTFCLKSSDTARAAFNIQTAQTHVPGFCL